MYSIKRDIAPLFLPFFILISLEISTLVFGNNNYSGLPAYEDNLGKLTLKIYEHNYDLIPGESYFGRNQYIEYLAGNSPVIITAPHGGSLTPSEINDRTWGTMVTDINTDLLAYKIYNEFHRITGLYPHVIICHLKRTKLDANREISEAAQTDKWAEYTWHEWRDFIRIASNSVIKQSGSGIYIDLHGHGHSAQRLEIGYLLSNSILQLNDADLSGYINKSSIQTLAYEASLGFSELIRGSFSFGGLMEARGFPSVPSPTNPNSGSDPYFSGGFNTQQYSSLHGGRISGFQIECNYEGVRNTIENRLLAAQAISESIVIYLAKHFGLYIDNLSFSSLFKIGCNWLNNTREWRNIGNLIGQWSFNDGTANDFSGFDHHGSVIQGDSSTSIEIIYDFERGSNVLHISNPPGHTVNSVVDCSGNSSNGGWADIRNAFTLTAWIKVDGFHTAHQYLITKGSSYQLTRSRETDGMRAYMSNFSPSIITDSTNVNDGQWHHITLLYDSSQSKRSLYIDGKEVNSDKQSGQLSISSESFIIGGRLSPLYDQRGWNGCIDEVRLYDYSLSCEEIIIDYNSSLPIPISSMECYSIPDGDYNFDCSCDLLDFSVIAESWLEY
jgi:hypothetical protein